MFYHTGFVYIQITTITYIVGNRNGKDNYYYDERLLLWYLPALGLYVSQVNIGSQLRVDEAYTLKVDIGYSSGGTCQNGFRNLSTDFHIGNVSQN